MAYVPPIPAPGYDDPYTPSWMNPHMFRKVPPFRPRGPFQKPNPPSYSAPSPVVPRIPLPIRPVPRRRPVITTREQRNRAWPS